MVFLQLLFVIVWFSWQLPFPSVFLVYYRALVNFTDSVVYSPELEDIYSLGFKEISEAVMDTVCLHYWIVVSFSKTVATF